MQRNNLSKILSVFLCLCLLAGCGSNTKNSEDYQDDYTENNSDDEYYYYEYGTDDYEVVPESVLNQNIKLSEQQFATLNNIFESIKVSYKNSELYCIDENLEAYYALNSMPVPESSTIITNNSVDYELLLSIVKSNNKKFNDKYYHKLSDKYLEKTVKYITEMVNFGLKENKYININILDYKLNNLKVVGYSDFGIAFYNYDDMTLALNVSVLEDYMKDNPNSFKDVIYHEAGHLLQDATIKRDDSLNMNYGMCYEFKDIKVNSLYWIWFIEGAAQSNSLLCSGLPTNESTTYNSFVRSLDMLTSTYALNHENVYELQYLTSQLKIEPIFELFQCKTKEDQREILNMMIAYNLCLDASDVILSVDLFEHMNIDDPSELKMHLEASIGQTLSKIFYKNLIDKIKKQTITLRDTFSLIALFENRLSLEIFFSDSMHIKYMGDFYNNYLFLQNSLFKEIAVLLNLSEEEIRQHYTNFFHTTNFKNFSSNSLNAKQNALYKKLYTDMLSPDSNHTVYEVFSVVNKSK